MYLHWHNDSQQWQPFSSCSAADRGLNYGDGLFETIRCNLKGEMPLWNFHQQRLELGLKALLFPENALEQVLNAIAQLPLDSRLAGGKLLITRGTGERGYALPQQPKLQIIWHSFSLPSWGIKRFPAGLNSVVCESVQLARQPLLAGIKHLNRLEQVLARHALPDNCQEMVLCDTEGLVVEGCMSNLFIVNGDQLITPIIKYCGVRGVIRQWLMEHYPVQTTDLTVEQLLNADALFFCNSLNGIIPVAQLGQHHFERNSQSWQKVLNLQNQLEAMFC